MGRTVVAALMALALSGFPAMAQDTVIVVERAWSRAALAGRNGAVYLTIAARTADRLIGVTSSVAESAELHESMSEQGVMKMRAVPALAVGPDKAAILAPGGYHIMLMNLRRPLQEGDRIEVTLAFEKAGSVTATAQVAKAGAPGPAADHGTHRGH